METYFIKYAALLLHSKRKVIFDHFQPFFDTNHDFAPCSFIVIQCFILWRVSDENAFQYI